MFRLLLVPLFLFATHCAPVQDNPPEHANTVWTVDLVRTLPGQQANYVASIETNWANARHIGRERGSILSYQAFVAPQDTARGWDVMLMTEYADSTEWANREALFQDIFASDEFVRVEPASPSSEMRTFFVGGVVMQGFVDQ